MSARAPFFSLALLLPSAAALDDGSAAFYNTLLARADGRADDNSTATLVKLVEWVNQTGAMCLDGTPGAYYHRPGTGSGKNKWYIHHQGGGWCESFDDCLGRSRTGLGSSAGYGPFTSLRGGYFDPTPGVNPMMYNWNMVHMNYCDGGSFSGNNETASVVQGATLHFRGKRVREAVYASLLRDANLSAATDVVISGCSAGGLATFIHTDQWCDALAADAPGVKCVGLPDSGFFLDYEKPAGLGTTPAGTYHAGLKWVFETMNTSAGVNQDCINAKGTGGVTPDDPAYLCQFAEHTAVFTHTPIFPLQSTYDSWQTDHVLFLPNTAADVQRLGDNLTKRITANLFGPHPGSGAFLDSCHHHCGAWNSIRIDGDLVSTAFAKWYAGLDAPGGLPPKRVWKQGQPYPCDACCKP